MTADIEHRRTSAPLRVNGIALLAVLVVAGMGITGVYYHIKAPALLAQMRREQSELPANGEGRVGRWLDFGTALIDQRIVQLRLSARQPWLVSYVVTSPTGEDSQEIWGVDMSGQSVSWTTREGMNVVVTLPAAKLLGHGPIGGDKALNVPRYAPDAVRPDANDRARYVVEWGLERLAAALSKDIEGARLIVRVGPSATPDNVANNEGR